MYLKRLTVKNFRGIVSKSLEFVDGLNVIAGPNESGKSSLREALRHAFLTPAPRGRAPAVAIRPWGTKGTTEVIVEFWHEGQDWLLKRVFFGKGSELMQGGRVVAQEDEVIPFLEERMANLAVLWSVQGDDKLAHVPSALQPSLAAAEAVTPGISRFEELLNARFEYFWSPTRSEPRKPLLQARDNLRAATRRKCELVDKLDALNASSQHLESLDEQLRTQQDQLAGLNQQLTHFRQQLTAWAQHRTAMADTARAEEALKAEKLWFQRWTRCVEDIEVQKGAAAEYQDKLRSLQAEIGPEPDQSLARSLAARLQYGRALIQQRLCQELEQLKAPGPEELTRLESLLGQVQAVEKVVLRTRESVRLQALIREQQATFDALQGQMALLAADADKAQAEAQKRDELQRGLEQWEQARAQFLDLWHEVERFKAKVQVFEIGPGPTQKEIQELKARQSSLEARRQQLLREELAALPVPDPQTLERLTRAEELRGQAAREALNIEDLERQVGQVASQLPALEQAVGRLEAARTQAQSVEREQAELERLRQQLESQRQPIEQTLTELNSYQAKLTGLQEKLGGEPDRAPLEALQARLREAQIRLQRRRQGELDSIRVPEAAQLARLEELEKLAQVPRGPRKSVVLAIGLGLTVIGFLVAMLGGLQALPSVGVGLGVGLLAGGLGFAFGPREVAGGFLVEREGLLTALAVNNLEQARQNLGRATLLKTHLRPHLNQEQPATDHYVTFDAHALETEIDTLLSQVDAAETVWKQAQSRYAESRSEFETLRLQNPQEKLRTQVQLLRSLNVSQIDVPDMPVSSWWEEVFAQLDSRLDKLRHASAAASSGELAAAIATLQEKRAAHLKLQSQAESARKVYAERYGSLPEPGLLQSFLEELGVKSLADAVARLERVRELKAQLKDVTGNPEDCRQLDLGQVAVELAEMPERIRAAEASFELSLKGHEERRQAREALLAQNPEPQIPFCLNQLRTLAQAHPEIGIVVPEQVDSEWLALLQASEPPVPPPADLDGGLVGEKLKACQAEVQAASVELNRRQGELEAKRQEMALLVGAEPALASLTNAGDAGCAESLREKLVAQRDALLATFGVESLEQARARSSQAQALRAQLDPEVPVEEELHVLRAQLDAPELLEGLSLAQLQQETRTLPARIEEANKTWSEAHRNWLSRREQKEELANENPEKLLAAAIDQLRELAGDRLTVPAEVTAAWALEAVQGLRTQLEEGEAQLALQRAQLVPPDISEAEAQNQVGLLETQIRQTDDFIKRLGGEVGQDQGKLNTQADLFYQLAKAQEACAAAEEESHVVEEQAEARKLLRAKLDEAKKELENDLVGPLRKLIGERLVEITRGRYQELRMEQNFRAEVVLRSDRVEAPITELSFGTREQLAFLSRLCLAELLSQHERHSLMFDDNLVHTDDDRLAIAHQLLLEVAGKAQVILLTCHPERYGPILEQAKVQHLETLAR